MICLNDFVMGRKGFDNLTKGLCISALEHCRQMKFRTKHV